MFATSDQSAVWDQKKIIILQLKECTTFLSQSLASQHASQEGSAFRGDPPPGGSASRGIWDTTGYGQQAGGTHPNGLFSCIFCYGNLLKI